MFSVLTLSWKELDSNLGEVWCILTLIKLLCLQASPHLNMKHYHFCHMQRSSLSRWLGAYSIKPLLKTYRSHTPDCFHPALIKDVIKRKNLSELAAPLKDMLTFCLDGRDYLRGHFLTASLETIFQLWKTRRRRGSWDEDGTKLWLFTEAHIMKATWDL